MYNDHYCAVSEQYDSFYSDYHRASVDAMSQHIQFSAGDSVADIGGGTGAVCRLLYEKFNLRNPVLCVDPSDAMLEIAQQKEGIETLKSTAEEFFHKCPSGREFSKILMCGCYHHFKDPERIFEGVARVLSAVGVCLVLRITEDSAPVSLMFTKAQGEFTYLDFDQIARLAESKGLRARVILDCQPCEMEKEAVFSFTRNRMLSSLSKFSSDEIEEGIREMAERYRGCEVIKSEYKFNMAIVTKT